ncbi:MAG: adenylate kinase [Acidobacteria bacterium]|nr:adenylate kinase [Acidobacteriota bacterium]
MGAPGAGKGTQAQLVMQKFGWPHISTGDILREIAQTDTPLGQHVKQVQASGQLVSDDILAEIVQERLRRGDCEKECVLDGFPRTIPQAKLLDRIAAQPGDELVVVNVAVGREALIQRLSGRRGCPQCGAVYNVYLHPPKQDEICDRCGAQLRMRSDDTSEAVARRLDVYEEKTAPVIEYYRQRGNLVDIDGGRPVDEVFPDVLRVIEERDPA